MSVKTNKNRYPYCLSRLADPVVVALKAVIAGKPLPKWTGVKFAEPITHTTQQPLDRLKQFADTEDPLDFDEKLERLVEIAVQYGICQGYAMRKAEVKTTEDTYGKIAAILERLEERDKKAKPKKPPKKKA